MLSLNDVVTISTANLFRCKPAYPANGDESYPIRKFAFDTAISRTQDCNYHLINGEGQVACKNNERATVVDIFTDGVDIPYVEFQNCESNVRFKLSAYMLRYAITLPTVIGCLNLDKPLNVGNVVQIRDRNIINIGSNKCIVIDCDENGWVAFESIDIPSLKFSFHRNDVPGLTILS